MADTAAETERLWRDDDVGALHTVCADPVVMATIGPVMDRIATLSLIERLHAKSVASGHTFWAVERKADRRVIGFTGLIRGDIPPIAAALEIGWRFASDCWGAGFATEAARASLAWVGANRPNEAVVAITSVGNRRSRAVMDRLGMIYQSGLDFDHPHVAPNSPLLRHVIYRKEPPL